jgi:glycosyltransferase involved in cell wall biosynthesis
LNRNKLLYFIYQDNYYGAESVVVSEINYLIEMYDITLICKDVHKAIFRNQLSREVKVFSIRLKEFPFQGVLNVSNMIKLWRLIRKISPSVILAHNNIASLYLHLLKPMLGACPLFITEHNNLNHVLDQIDKADRLIYLRTKILDMIVSRIRVITAGGVDIVISVSESVQEYAINRYSYSQEKCRVLNNGIDTDYFPYSYKAKKKDILSPSENSIVIGSLGRLEEQKGYIYLLKAFNILKNEKYNVKLIIAGDGTLKHDLMELCVKLSFTTDEVKFLGKIDYPIAFLQSIDIFVLSSLWEGLPISILEAMAIGIPSVASSVDGTKDVMTDGYDGVLVEAANPIALATGIKRVMDDEQIRLVYSYNSRKTVLEKFQLSKRNDKLQSLIRLFT